MTRAGGGLLAIAALLAAVAAFALWPSSARNPSGDVAEDLSPEAVPSAGAGLRSSPLPAPVEPVAIVLPAAVEASRDVMGMPADPRDAIPRRDGARAAGDEDRLAKNRLGAYADPEFWKVKNDKGWQAAAAWLEARELAGPPSTPWARANALLAAIVMRDAPPWEALQRLVEVFVRVCSRARLPTTPPDPGHAIWRATYFTDHGAYFEGDLTAAGWADVLEPHEGDWCRELVLRVETLNAALEVSQRADAAVHTLVEFVRLNGAIAYSEDADRLGSRATAVSLLPRIRTFLEAHRGAATERVRPMVDWMRAWYPSAARAPLEEEPESTPLPPLPSRLASRPNAFAPR
jgi:hypothetical protein